MPIFILSNLTFLVTLFSVGITDGQNVQCSTIIVLETLLHHALFSLKESFSLIKTHPSIHADALNKIVLLYRQIKSVFYCRFQKTVSPFSFQLSKRKKWEKTLLK